MQLSADVNSSCCNGSTEDLLYIVYNVAQCAAMSRERRNRLASGDPKQHPNPLSIFTARRNARIASPVLATTIPFFSLSVCHTPVLCQNDCT